LHGEGYVALGELCGCNTGVAGNHKLN